MLHCGSRDLVGEAHALDFLWCLECARSVEQWRPVDRFRERVEPGLRVCRRLAYHPVSRLRAEAELETDAPELLRHVSRGLEGAQRVWTRIGRVVAWHEAHVLSTRPCGRILRRHLYTD